MKNYRIFVISAVLNILVLLSGCDEFSSAESFETIHIPQERLTQIEMLDIESMRTQEPNQPETIFPEQQKPPEKQIDLTLEQCRAIALENNLDLKVQLINPSIAEEVVSEEQAKFESSFHAELAFEKVDAPTSTSLSGTQTKELVYDFGLEIPLDTGGTINFDFANDWLKTNNTYSTINPAIDTDISFSISQPLLRGAGKRANTHSIRIARYEAQVENALTKFEVIRVLAAVDRIYWRLYAARREFEVRKQQYELSNTQLDRARRFVDAGSRAKIEITRAQAGVAEPLEAIIDSENNVRDRERELKRILNKAGIEMETPTVILPKTEPDPVHYKLDRSRLIGIALENRMEMLEVELQIAKDVSNIDYLENQALPLVTMDYTYNVNGLGRTNNEAYDMLFDKGYEDHRLGLQLLIPLGNQAAKSRVRQAFQQKQRRLATKKNRKSVIELEVLNAIDQLEANWRRILASRQNAIAKGRLYEAEIRQFEIGLGTSTDVLEAQTNLADAQNAEIKALAEYQISLVDIAYATGTLLGSAKVEWQPAILRGDF